MAHAPRRLGLRTKMALSYLLTALAVVLFAQLVLARFVLRPSTASNDLTARALSTAQDLARQSAASSQPTLGELGAKELADGKAHVGDGRIVVPGLDGADDGQQTALALVLDRQLVTVASSFPARFPVGESSIAKLPGDASNLLKKASGSGEAVPSLEQAALSSRGAERVVWALASIQARDSKLAPATSYVYVEAPPRTDASSVPINVVALIALLSLPVGLAFGWMATRGLRRRLAALTAASQALAGGDYSPRLVPTSRDEIGQLEANFTAMAEQIRAATGRQEALAGTNARLEERNRISGELHDTLSQELFSLTLLAGGLEQALPPDSPLRPRVTQLQATSKRATEELRALLLDLRPTVLSDGGVVAALEELAKVARQRFALDVVTELGEVPPLATAGEHAIVRITQEAITNAAKHADPSEIAISLGADGRVVTLEVHDDGKGFDLSAPSSGLGLRLMRERVDALSGILSVESAPGRGTSLRVGLPVAARTPLPPPPVEVAV